MVELGEPLSEERVARERIASTVRSVVESKRLLEGALLPILHGIQDELGHLPQQVFAEVAAALNLSRAEVFGVASYYPHFHLHPVGRTVVQVCRAEACKSKGGDALIAHARSSLGCSEGSNTSSDGAFTVEAVYCLGLCSLSPAARIGARPHARLTTAAFDAAIAAVAAGAESR